MDLNELKKKYNIVPATAYKRIRKKSSCLGTGIFQVDMAIAEIDDDGYAGIRGGDIAEAIGPNNSHKTSLAISMILEAQRRFPGNNVIAVFTEAFDPDRLEACGVDLDRLLIYLVYDEETDAIDFSLAEKACDAVLHLIRDPEIVLVVWDSVAATTPKGLEYDGSKEREFGKASVALLAKIFNEFTLKFKNHTAGARLLLINHYREAIDTNSYSLIPEDKSKLKSPGGRGSEFMADVRILCTSTVEMEEVPHSVLGIRQGKRFECKWMIFKNKYCPSVPHRTVKGTFDPRKNKFLNTSALIDLGAFFTVKGKKEGEYHSKLSAPIVKSGSWVRVGDNRLQGVDKLADYLDENEPELVDKLKKEMYKLEDEFFQDKKPSLDELLEK